MAELERRRALVTKRCRYLQEPSSGDWKPQEGDGAFLGVGVQGARDGKSPDTMVCYMLGDDGEVVAFDLDDA